MGLQNTNKNAFRGLGNLVIWLWKVLEIFLKELKRTLVKDAWSVGQELGKKKW